MIGVDAILDDAKLQERLALGGQILPVGGTARVSDEGCRHGGKCTNRVPLPQLLPYHSYETLLAPVWRGSGRRLRRPLDVSLTDSAPPAGMNG